VRPSRTTVIGCRWTAEVAVWIAAATALAQSGPIGGEAGIPVHLRDGDELTRSVSQLVEYGKRLFTANWTDQDGGGCPLSR
jgi:hypothetical protein